MDSRIVKKDSRFSFVAAHFKQANVPKTNLEVHTGIGFWCSVGHKLKNDRLAIFWLFILSIIILISLLGPELSHYNANQIHVSLRNAAPNSSHWFGSDRLGRDLFIRTCLGIRVSLLVALVSTFFAITLGTIYGMIMAFFGGWVDELLMRIIEIFNSLPSLLVTMLIMTVLGNDIGTMLFALAITSWSYSARQARGLVMQLRGFDYITAAVMLGTPLWRIMLRHLVPNMMSILILDIGQSIPSNIFAEASLSFLGLGLQAPNTSLGILIADGQNQMLLHPMQLYIPIICLILIVLAFNIIGDSFRDALDPRFEQA